MADNLHRVPTFGPGRVIVGHSSEFQGYFYALFEHSDHRADAMSDRGQFPTLTSLIMGTRGFIDWARVPRPVIHSLLSEGDPDEQEATRLLAAALSA